MKYSRQRSGQTLIEVMVALFVLTTGFLGIVTLLSQSIYLSKNITTETTATYLASEGIELAKNITDHDIYQQLAGLGTGWAKGSPDTAFEGGGYFEIDYTTCNKPPDQSGICSYIDSYAGTAFQRVFESTCESDPLYFDAKTDTYLYPGDANAGDITTLAPFSRCIQVTQNGNEMTVESTVFWKVGLGTQSVNLEDDFYNWRPS
jgi:type II secretory pathway pseudopilin PulG